MKSILYTGHVWHARHVPKRHAFRIPVYFYGFDISELHELDRSIRGFGYNRFRPAALWDRDYLREGKAALQEKLSEFMPGDFSQVVLVTSARFMGYVFNPVSFYLCFRDDTLVAAVAEVNNTFGDRHVYVLPDLEKEGEVYRAFHDKEFHVSPFNDMQGRYEFRFHCTSDELRITVNMEKEGGHFFEATLAGRPRAFTTTQLTLTCLRYPLLPFLTLPRILFQAARLYYQKHLNVYTRPEPVHPMTIRRREDPAASSGK